MAHHSARERDTVAVDSYVFDALMPDLVGHDRAPSAFVVYLHLWRHGRSTESGAVQLSLRAIAEGTGLSKRGVQGALRVLSRRELIGVRRRSITDVPVYVVRRPWRTAK